MTIEALPAWVQSGEWDTVKDQLLTGALGIFPPLIAITSVDPAIQGP